MELNGQQLYKMLPFDLALMKKFSNVKTGELKAEHLNSMHHFI